MKTKIYFGIAISLIFFSCGEGEATEKAVDARNDTIVSRTLNKVETPHQLMLNEGLKWEISRGMKNPLEKIDKLIHEFKKDKVVDYQLLGDDIEKQTKKLIRKCDMTGKSTRRITQMAFTFFRFKRRLW